MNLQHKIINHVLTQNEWMKDELIQFKNKIIQLQVEPFTLCLLYTSPSPRDRG